MIMMMVKLPHMHVSEAVGKLKGPFIMMYSKDVEGTN